MSYSGISSIVVDANFSVKAVLPPGTGKEMAHFKMWQMSHIQVLAPDIWHAEITSAVRQMVYIKEIQPHIAQVVLNNLFALPIQIVTSDIKLCSAALKWAERLGQSKAYDSFYLALAEELRTTLWTDDRRLANRAHQVGADWVHLVSEEQ